MSSFECDLLKPSIQDQKLFVIIGAEQRVCLGTFQNATYIIHLQLFFKVEIFKDSRGFQNGGVCFKRGWSFKADTQKTAPTALS